jgi:hypothetical protein
MAAYLYKDIYPFIHPYISIDIYISSRFKREMKAGWFFLIRLLIVETEVCHLSICWRKSKRKLSIWKRTFQTYLSLLLCHFNRLKINCSVTVMSACLFLSCQQGHEQL